MDKAPSIKCPPGAGESILRITKADEIKEKIREEVLSESSIDIWREQGAVLPRDIQTKLDEMEQLIMEIENSIVWGVYGRNGELLEVIGKKYKVERLQEQDALALQRLYTEGLANEPLFFGSTLEVERAKTIVQVKKHIRDNYVMGIKQPCVNEQGEEKEKLVAMASIERQKNEEAHKAKAGLLYVIPSHRERGLAEMIAKHGLEKVIEGREEELKGIEQVLIKVVTLNKFAINFYRKLGFKGGDKDGDIERQAAKRGDTYVDWLNMKFDVIEARRQLKLKAALQHQMSLWPNKK